MDVENFSIKHLEIYDKWGNLGIISGSKTKPIKKKAKIIKSHDGQRNPEF
jgi:hypothetical protein